MALKSRNAGTPLPEGAVPCSEEEALNYQKKLIDRWPAESDVRVSKLFFLKYAPAIAGLTSALSSVMIKFHFKRYFNTDYRVFALTFVPGLALPLYVSYYFTEQNITNSILLMKVKCPMCLNLKFAVQQFYCSLLFPSLYSFSAHAMYSDMHGTYKFPDFKSEPKMFWKETFRGLKSGLRTYQIIGLFQAVMVLAVPYMQHKELFNVVNSLNVKEDYELIN